MVVFVHAEAKELEWAEGQEDVVDVEHLDLDLIAVEIVVIFEGDERVDRFTEGSCGVR